MCGIIIKITSDHFIATAKKTRRSHLRSLLVVGVKGVAHGAFLGALGARLDEVVVDVGLDEDAAAGAAALALVEEQAEVARLHRVLH